MKTLDIDKLLEDLKKVQISSQHLCECYKGTLGMVRDRDTVPYALALTTNTIYSSLIRMINDATVITED